MFELALNSSNFWLTISIISLLNTLVYNGAKQKSQEQAYQWLHTLIKSHGVIIPPKAEEERKRLQDHAINEIGRNDKIMMISVLVCIISFIGFLVTN